MKKELTVEEPIHVRTEKLSGGSYSISLHINVDKRKEYKILIELQDEANTFECEEIKPEMDLISYIQYIADKDVRKTARKVDMNALIHHLQGYDKTGISLRKVNREYLVGFVEYMKTAIQEHPKKERTIHPNTQSHYYKRLSYVLNYAVTEELIAKNPMDKVPKEERPKQRKSEREYLTIDEIITLAKTDFYNETLKRAFLFSCFCGLRHCDVKVLTWENLRTDKSGKVELRIVQQKTKEQIILPLSNEALKQLPARKGAPSKAKVFDNLISLGRSNEILSRWAKDAGIEKHLTFHVARHTHATMMITLGADIYTVSKLLGHTNIQTTQIYAKIVDESKEKAIDLIPNMTSVLSE